MSKVLFASHSLAKTSIACLIISLMILSPLTPLSSVAWASPSSIKTELRKETKVAPGDTITSAVNAPGPMMFAPVITATKTDTIIGDDGDSKADPGGAEKIEYTVTINNTGTTDATNVVYTDTIDPHTTLVGGSITTQPIAVADTFTALGNVRITVADNASASGGNSGDLLNNDCDPDPAGGPCTNAGLTISTLGGDNSAPFAGTTTQGGQVTATTGDGSFQYNPAPGFEGTDTFTYTVTDGTGKTDMATVTITVGGMIWFVNAAAPAGGDGRLATPFNCLVGVGCFSATTADDPGDYIFLFSGTYNDNAALVLLNNQKLIGAAATAPLAGGGSITGFTIPPFSDALPATSGASPVITSTASGIQLASGNLLRGFTVGNTATTAGNYDIANTATVTVGTLTISEVLLNGTGGLFRADSGGVLSVAFGSAATSNAGSNGIHVANASGSITLGSGTITGVAGSDIVITGGTVSLNSASTITHAAGANAMVSINGGHATGIVTFTGTLNATSGTGLQFDNADSTYNFNGTTTLNGGDAGIDILNGSAGTFNFGGTTITNPSGVALFVSASSGAINISGLISKNTDGKMIDFDNYDTGTAAISGNLSCTSLCDGVEVTNDGTSSGTVNFSGATKTLNTGTSTAVNLDNNDSGNVNFTGGGLDIDTTSGVGFNAINGGAVTVTTGTNANTIDSTTGTALNVANTTIGASGLTFKSIAANGASSGVVLNSTGATAGLTVTGDGNTSVGGNSSGGTIQNTTSHAISLINTRSPSFTNINIQSAGRSGIDGQQVTNFTLANSIINNVGTAAAGQHDESNVSFNDDGLFTANPAPLTGTVSITQNVLNNARRHGIQIENGTGTISNLTITNNTLTSSTSAAVSLGTGILILIQGSASTNANLTTGTISNNTVTNFPSAEGIAVLGGAGSSSNNTSQNLGANGTPILISGNTISGQSGAGARMGSNGIRVSFNGQVGVCNSTISNNTVSFVDGQGISVFMGGTVTGTTTINNNILNLNQTDLAGTQGLAVQVDDGPAGLGTSAADYNFNITNNTVQNYEGFGIRAIARASNGKMDLAVQNNKVGSTIQLTNRNAIRVDSGSSVGDTNVCMNMSGNTNLSNGALNGSGVNAGIGLRKQGSVATTNDFGIAGIAANPTNAQVQAFVGSPVPPGLNLTNAAGGVAGSNANGNGVDIISGNNFVSCTLSAKLQGPQRQPYYAARPSNPNKYIPSEVTNSSLFNGFTASLTRLAAAVDSFITPTTYAAENPPSSGGETMIASSHGTAGTTQIEQPASQLPTQKSALRLNHASSSKFGTRISKLDTADVKNKKSDIRSNAARSSRTLTPVSGETVGPIIIGTLRPGDSVTITFQVTVNNPPNLTGVPPGTPKVTNQGTVSGSNFTNVLTDDPAVGGASDPTDTPVDLFDTSTNLVSNLNPSNFGDQVTFTATINETPVQGAADPTGTVDFIDTSNGNAVICNDVPLSGGQAQCQTSSLTAATHNIRADYSGDGNFDPSQSNVVAQVVNACTPNPIVTSTADSGAGTLRDAVASVCTGTTITFNLPGAGPHTITLTTGELAVTKNVTINNNSGESIAVSGNNASRVFNINSGKTVNIIGLTLSGGSNAGNGGGILNDGTLTVVNSTITGNHAGTDGGGISTSATATSLTLINTTVSGNNADGNGGGVAVLGGTMTSSNSTITNNFADNDNNATGTGGGIAAAAGTTTLKNTIVAGNFNEDGASDAADDISGTVDAASSFNLIGTGGAGGLTNGVNNNQVGVATPGLGPLASNGGLTQTHALLSTSPAIETGSNANLPTDTFDLDGDANTAETLPVDQRGPGFPRVADSSDVDLIQTVDIGAFELHPSVEDIANQSTNEDTVKNVTFNLGDDTGSLISTVTATSSNTTLVPNANLVITGSGGSRNLQMTPAANQSGTTTITVTVTATNGRTAVDTFDLTVSGVNDPPSGTDNTVSTAEDTAYTFTAADFGFTDPNDVPPNTLLAVKITTLPGLGTLTNNNVPVNAGDFIPVANINGGLLKFTPASNGNGTPYTTFTFQVQDNGGGTDLDPTPNTMTINVTAVNDGPVNTVPGPQTTLINTAKVFSSGNGNQISVADVDAGSNPVKITLTASNGTITLSTTAGLSFITGDGTADATMMFTGTLTAVNTALNGMSFNPTTAFTGAASLQIVSDDQGNTGSGGPLTDTDSVNITVNDAGAPVVTTTAGNLSYTENDPATAIDPGLTVTDSNSTDFVGATVAITAGFVSAQDTLAFTNQNGITGNYNSGTGVLTLTGTSSVANYQTALRSVTYQNSSENPTSSRTVTFTANDGTNTGSATRGITITAVNDAPVNTVPGPQSTNVNTPLTFSGGNQISIADVDAGTNAVQVTLTATNGTLTLSSTAGLAFTVGDGTADATMTFTGTIANINAALTGMTFTPTNGFNGAATVTITTNDQGNSGTGGPLTDTDSVNIAVATNITIQDAKVAEPASGSTNMLFTVSLPAPAASTVTVNFTTAVGGGNPATPGTDFSTTSGTVTFLTGEQVKVIAVPVLSDADNAETDETFLVNLSSPSAGASIADGTATGTITVANPAGTFVISEIRTSGPAGAGDDFVELYNNTDTPLTVAASDGSSGYGLYKLGGTCGATPTLIGTIPNGTIIPARGHYLFVGSQYSLANYGGTGAAAGDATLLADIESDYNVGIFTTANVANVSSVNRLDAVGFGSNSGSNCDLLREGTILPANGTTTLEGSYQRDECGKLANSGVFGNCPAGGLPKDSNNNVQDFFWADTAVTLTPAGQHLGAPGPQNKTSPIVRNAPLPVLILDGTKASSVDPNRLRDFAAVTNGSQGTLTFRRRVRNDTGAPVTRLRFRIIDLSTAPVTGGIADMRALDSSSVSVSGILDSQTCLASTGSATTPCTVTVQGTLVETPPAQAFGGATNSTFTVTLGTPLAAGASVNLQLRFGLQTTGSFKFFFNVEALP